MKKVAQFNFTGIKPVIDPGLVKLASSGRVATDEAKKVIEAEVKKHPNSLFFRAKAIEADVPNNNGDSFTSEELKKSYNSFVGVPFFTNHNNQDIENAKGKVVWAEWDDADNSVYIVAFVDRDAYPNLCRGIEKEYMTGVSMGCSVEYSVCSICKNKASTIDEYCTHIKNYKGRKFTGSAKNIHTGETLNLKNAKVYEDNFGIRFIELSGVADPACSSCRIDVIYDNEEFSSCCSKDEKAAKVLDSKGMIRAASSCYNELSVLKSAALQKEASQEDVNALNECLKTLEGVSVKLIQNRDSVDMEFASDIVDILANLQDFVSELVQAGYGQLPESTGAAVPGSLPDETQGELGAIPQQPVAAEEELGEPGTTNVEEPLMETPTAPAQPLMGESLEELNQATRPSPKSRQTSKLTRPKRPDRNSKVEDESEMSRRKLPNKSATEKEAAKQVLDDNWQEKIGKFSNTLRDNLKSDPILNNSEHGGQINMSVEPKKVEAKSSHTEDLHLIQEKQLDKANVGANPREEQDRETITQDQLEEKRQGERETITEDQLEAVRENASREVITQKQLDPERKDQDKETITQDQLEREGYRVGKEPETITEDQLSNPPTDTPWARSAKNVTEHIQAAAAIVAKASVASGVTPGEALDAACEACGETATDNLAFAKTVWNTKTDVESASVIATRAKYWGKRGVKVASNAMDVEEAIYAYASDMVRSEGLNPEVLIEALDGIKSNNALDLIETKVDEIMSQASTETEKVNVKSQISDFFSSRKEDKKKEVVAESKSILEKLTSNSKGQVADYVFETNMKEIGYNGSVDSPEFDSATYLFAKNACKKNNMKLASLVNVTIDNDVITIAVETDNESVEIPIGEGKEEIPEDTFEPMSEEALPEEEPLPEEEALPQLGGEDEDILGLASSKADMKKKAQFGGGAPAGDSAGGGGAAPPSDMANMPGDESALPEGGGVQTFTEDEVEEEELPGEGEQQIPGSICPMCHSNDTETGRKDLLPGQFECQDCDAIYSYTVNVEVLNPEDILGEKSDDLEMPEAPELPVAAFVDMSKGVLSKYASDFEEGNIGCPACGSSDVKVDGVISNHKIACTNCKTDSSREVLINIDEPTESSIRVAWSVDPKKRKCAGCQETRKLFASDLVFNKMLKEASNIEFPTEKAKSWIDKHYGADAEVSYGPHAGEKLAKTVIAQLESFGLKKIKYMERLCSTQTQPDPMDECMKTHKKKGYTVAESTRLCGCLKDKFASEEDNNLYLEAFSGLIDTNILRKMASYSFAGKEEAAPKIEESEMSIDDLVVEAADDSEEKVKAKTPELKLEKDQAIDKKAKKGSGMKSKKIDRTVLENEDNVPRGDSLMGHEGETIPEAKDPVVPCAGDSAKMGHENETIPAEQEVAVPTGNQYLGNEEPICEKEIDTKSLGNVAASDKKVKIVEDIEASDDVPRNKATMGEEEPCDCDGPDVPRGDATIGKEEPCDCDEPSIPVGPDAEEVAMRGRVANRAKQQDRIARARRDKAIKVAARMVAEGSINDSEFDDMVSDLSGMSLDRMDYYANKIASSKAPQVRQASLGTPVVIEDTGIVVKEEKSLKDKLAEAFTIGNKGADVIYKKDSDFE